MATESEMQNPEEIDFTTDDKNVVKNKPMRIITVNIPAKYISAIENAVKNGFTCSRSELVRSALEYYLCDIIKEVTQKIEVLSIVTENDEVITDKHGTKWHVKKK
jgi:Arc/MetJ-type ribon-helix-helix transcriptional regulator